MTSVPVGRDEVHGTRAWFEMLGTLLVETSGRVRLPDRVSFLERYEDGHLIDDDGVVQGIVLEVVGGRASYRVGVRPADVADVEVTVTRSAALVLNLLRSADPAYETVRRALAEAGHLRVEGDAAPLSELFDLVHDAVVDRTRWAPA